MKGNLSALQSTGQKNGIAIEEKKIKLLRGGRGKQRECCKSFGREVLYTQRKEKVYQNYSIKGYNNQFRNHRSETSLKELMSSCKDFVEGDNASIHSL